MPYLSKPFPPTEDELFANELHNLDKQLRNIQTANGLPVVEPLWGDFPAICAVMNIAAILIGIVGIGAGILMVINPGYGERGVRLSPDIGLAVGVAASAIIVAVLLLFASQLGMILLNHERNQRIHNALLAMLVQRRRKQAEPSIPKT
jgi:ABC-type dipeptide/oligopeptide/nickel transport system permease component